MKEIGEYLKSIRKSNGVSLEEASDDLNITKIELENIEDGNVRAFKDVYTLRELVKNYAKYLGVETSEILDEFNDFMFEHTSKISIEDIKEAKKMIDQKNEQEKNKVVSPYTIIPKPKFHIDINKIKPLLILIIVLIAIVLVIIGYKIIHKDNVITSELIINKGEVLNEFTY